MAAQHQLTSSLRFRTRVEAWRFAGTSRILAKIFLEDGPKRLEAVKLEIMGTRR